MPPPSTRAPSPLIARMADHLTRAWLHRGPLPIALLPLALLFGILSALRRTLYRLGILRSVRLPVPVIVIGNRVAGGAGKTPTAIAVVQHLQARGLRVGVVSRGHGRSAVATRHASVVHVRSASTAAEVGDEPLLIYRRTGAPMAVGADRVAAAQALLGAHPNLHLIVCDDGLQHLRLARNIEVIVFDERGAGNGWLLPAGPLRESIHTPPLSPATQQIVLYNATQPSTPLPGHLASRQLSGACRLADWWRGAPAQPFASIPEQGGLAVAGIAVPQRFFDQLRTAGLAIDTLALGDHFDFATLPWPAHTPRVILTEKDAVKLAPEVLARERPHCDVWVAALDFHPDPAFFAALDAACDAACGAALAATSTPPG